MSDRHSPQTQNALEQNTFSKIARYVLTVKETELWRQLGFQSFRDWATRAHSIYPGALKKSSVYQYLLIAQRLGSLTDKELEDIGVRKCIELSKLPLPGQSLERKWIAGANEMEESDFKRAIEKELRKTRRPVVLGEYLNPAFRGLQYAPSCEQGVVLLFGMVAEELGFTVQCVRSKYPDCIAIQRVSERPQRSEQRRIEFEFKSSLFRHDPEESDLIVCWEDDLKQCAPLPVLELKSKIKILPRTAPGPSAAE